MNKPTPQQEAAIMARGNILMVAGAGAGKTRTLVERCMAWLLDPENPGSMDEVLMVTFTEAAATEMRQRLRARLEEAGGNTPSPHILEQLALLETSWVCTLHSFCFHLVREHFYTLGLDPQLIVLAEERAQLLARQALDAVLQKNYIGGSPAAGAIQETIQSLGGDSDLPARELVMAMHHYTQTLRDPEAWFEMQVSRFKQTEPESWREWLMVELGRSRHDWQKRLQGQPMDKSSFGLCAVALGRLPENPTRAAFASVLDTISSVRNEASPRDRKALDGIFSNLRFLQSVCAVGEIDPLQEDLNWSAPSMLAVLDLTQQFGEAYRAAKREAGGIDFHDIEQFALQLLWEKDRRQTSAIARQWRAKLRLVFVDEYQDINGAQEAIIQALGRDEEEGNRFLVGDVKQSIYRFRLADPRIFLKCQQEWCDQRGAHVISLSDNFRSHEGILNFVNSVFSSLMHEELGGIEYDETVRLRFGNGAGRPSHAADAASPPRVELHLRRIGRNPEDGDEETVESSALSNTEQEARIVGRRLMELKNTDVSVPGQPVRKAGWSDMVILLRSPRNKAEAYVKEFARLGVPLSAVRGGFHESLEVRDLLSLLQVLDNPSQDLPLLAVLRSPLVGLTADELAAIRLVERPGRYWTALRRWHQENPGNERVNTFLNRFEEWRRQSRLVGVSQLLEKVVEETAYGGSTAGGSDGLDEGNVSRLLHLTLQFDQFRGEGLYRFLQFVKAQQDNEVDVEPAGQPLRDAVRLMSIHQSKGLEFPIVVLADLAKRFNLEDLRGRVILDEEFGLCPQVKPPGARQFYPSLPYWLAQRRQKREIYGEELRLLYVAMTRAADRLILFGSARSKTISGKWGKSAERGLGTDEILEGRSFMDWFGGWFAMRFGVECLDQSGQNELLNWRIYDAAESAADELPVKQFKSTETSSVEADSELLRTAKVLAEWRYPFSDATRRLAKASVTALRRELAAREDEEAEQIWVRPSFTSRSGKDSGLSAAEIGSAHHAFLEGVSLDEAGSEASLKKEATRLRERGSLSEAEAACLDFKALANFWRSDRGRQLLSQRQHVRRELPFTARFSPAELAKPSDLEAAGITAADHDEFIVVQGVIDLAVILPDEIWVLDFKTDQFPESDLAAKVEMYRSQLNLYARAMARIYGRPVTTAWLHFFAIGKTVEILPDKIDSSKLIS